MSSSAAMAFGPIALFLLLVGFAYALPVVNDACSSEIVVNSSRLSIPEALKTHRCSPTEGLVVLYKSNIVFFEDVKKSRVGRAVCAGLFALVSYGQENRLLDDVCSKLTFSDTEEYCKVFVDGPRAQEVGTLKTAVTSSTSSFPSEYIEALKLLSGLNKQSCILACGEMRSEMCATLIELGEAFLYAKGPIEESSQGTSSTRNLTSHNNTSSRSEIRIPNDRKSSGGSDEKNSLGNSFSPSVKNMSKSVPKTRKTSGGRSSAFGTSDVGPKISRDNVIKSLLSKAAAGHPLPKVKSPSKTSQIGPKDALGHSPQNRRLDSPPFRSKMVGASSSPNVKSSSSTSEDRSSQVVKSSSVTSQNGFKTSEDGFLQNSVSDISQSGSKTSKEGSSPVTKSPTDIRKSGLKASEDHSSQSSASNTSQNRFKTSKDRFSPAVKAYQNRPFSQNSPLDNSQIGPMASKDRSSQNTPFEPNTSGGRSSIFAKSPSDTSQIGPMASKDRSSQNTPFKPNTSGGRSSTFVKSSSDTSQIGPNISEDRSSPNNPSDTSQFGTITSKDYSSQNSLHVSDSSSSSIVKSSSGTSKVVPDTDQSKTTGSGSSPSLKNQLGTSKSEPNDHSLANVNSPPDTFQVGSQFSKTSKQGSSVPDSSSDDQDLADSNKPTTIPFNRDNDDSDLSNIDGITSNKGDTPSKQPSPPSTQKTLSPVSAKPTTSTGEDTVYDEEYHGYGTWHFVSIFLLMAVVVIVGYFLVHNRKKLREGISGYVSEKGRRRHNYRPLSQQ